MNARINPFFILIVGLSLASCTDLQLKKIPAETYFAQKWKAIDLNDVEIYPTFDFCDELASKEVLKACFENEVTKTFYEALSAHQILVSEELRDTLYIGFIVNEKGIYCIDSLHISDTILKAIPELEPWIHDACEQLPKAYPARIQNIPVKTRFKIPLILQTEN